MSAERLRGFGRHLWDGFEENDLLTYSSAIAFRVFLSIVPLLLFGFALLGFLQLGDIWRNDISPNVRDAVSPDVFRVLDDTVTHVLSQKQGIWLTLGAALSVWEVSGAMRLAMGALNRVYDAEEERDLRRQFLISIALAVSSIFLIGLAIAVVKLGPLAVDAVLGSSLPVLVCSLVLRWAIAAALLLLTVGLIVHYGPDRDRPLLKVTSGAAVAIGCWIGASLLFGLYLTQLAQYGSLFGNLATVFILLEYVWISVIAFIAGALIESEESGRGE